MLEPCKALVDQVFYGCCHLQLLGPGFLKKTLQGFIANSIPEFVLIMVSASLLAFGSYHLDVFTQQFLPFFRTWTPQNTSRATVNLHVKR